MIARLNPTGVSAMPGRGPALSHALARKLCPLEAGALSDRAKQRTGLSDFGDPALELRLGVLADSINREADLHPLGRFLAWVHLSDLLATRLRFEHAWSDPSSFAHEPIQAPIFITGVPRSGSTFLHELLAQDPNHRAPLVWEVMSPLPGNTRRRILHARRCLWWFRKLAPEADSVHPIRASSAHECIAIHSYTFLSREFIATFRASSYEKFIETADWEPVYAWEKKFLQCLQRGEPPRTWVLKAPDHVYGLEALLRVFPDARIVQTHRDPLQVLESSVRLSRVVQSVFARPQDHGELIADEARRLAEGLHRLSVFRTAHPELLDRFVDIQYEDLTGNPSGAVRELYRKLGLPLDPATLERARVLAASRSRYLRTRNAPTLPKVDVNAGVYARQIAGQG